MSKAAVRGRVYRQDLSQQRICTSQVHTVKAGLQMSPKPRWWRLAVSCKRRSVKTSPKGRDGSWPKERARVANEHPGGYEDIEANLVHNQTSGADKEGLARVDFRTTKASRQGDGAASVAFSALPIKSADPASRPGPLPPPLETPVHTGSAIRLSGLLPAAQGVSGCRKCN